MLAALLAGAAASHAAQAIDVAGADNEFGFRLLNAVQRMRPGGNVLLSPVSAALNLSLVLNGSAGKTRDEMLAMLSLKGDLAAVNAANAHLIELLRTPSKNITLSVADSLWVDSRRATLRADYVEQTQSAYDAQMTALDFSDPAAVARINGWAAKETHDRIPRVLDRLDPADVALLLNAVYFKGQWARRFDRSHTQLRDFKLVGGSVKQLPRMAQSARFDYFETPELQGIRPTDPVPDDRRPAVPVRHRGRTQRRPAVRRGHLRSIRLTSVAGRHRDAFRTCCGRRPPRHPRHR